MQQRNLYIAIMQAAQSGSPLNLTAAEVFILSQDEAVATLAANAVEDDEWTDPLDWSRIDPYRERHPAHHKRV